jgi:hypothetical protein
LAFPYTRSRIVLVEEGRRYYSLNYAARHLIAAGTPSVATTSWNFVPIPSWSRKAGDVEPGIIAVRKPAASARD